VISPVSFPPSLFKCSACRLLLFQSPDSPFFFKAQFSANSSRSVSALSVSPFPWPASDLLRHRGVLFQKTARPLFFPKTFFSFASSPRVFFLFMFPSPRLWPSAPGPSRCKTNGSACFLSPLRICFLAPLQTTAREIPSPQVQH